MDDNVRRQNFTPKVKPVVVVQNQRRGLRVGICHTKKAAKPLLDAFAEGVQKAGDTPVIINRKVSVDVIASCNITIQASAYNKNINPASKENSLRLQVQSTMKALGRRCLIMDTGCIDSANYTQIGYGGIKGLASFHNQKSHPDRWLLQKREVLPWRADGKNIVILGQNRFGISTQERDIFLWYDETIEEIRKYTDRPIIYRHHPKCDIDYQNSEVIGSRNTSISTDLENAWCVVAFSTNAVVDAIIHGIPVFTPDPRSIAYSVGNKNLAEIEQPTTFNRGQWLCDLAYAEWNVEEMRQGLPWMHLRPYVKDKS